MDARLFDLYTDYLIASTAQTSATGLSRLTDETISHDAISRMLASEAQSSKQMYSYLKPLLGKIASETGVLVIDDAIAEKPYSDETDVICWHYDHCQRRSIKGINFVSLLYSNNGLSAPLSVQPIAKTEEYLQAKTGLLKRRSPVSKLEYAEQMLLYAKRLKVPFQYILADSWYASANLMRFVQKRLRAKFIFAIKANRKVALSKSQQRRGIYHRIDELTIMPEETLTVYLEGINSPLLLGRHDFKNGDGSSGIVYLLSNDTQLSARQMFDIYQRRWTVECYHKSLKQNASLQSSPARTVRSQRNHLFASVCAFIKLESLKLSTNLNHFALKNTIYMRALVVALDELATLKRLHGIELALA
jgi:hypothetical protein